MTDSEDDKPEKAPEQQALPPRPQRPKMSLGEQQAFMTDLLRRCEMHGPDRRGQWAGLAVLSLTQDDMVRLEVIEQTLAVFEAYKADVMVRDEISRRRRRQ